MSYVIIKGRGLKFNQMAVIIMAQKCDPDNYAASSNYASCYAGLKANCYVKGEELDLTFEQVCDWVEELTPEEIQQIDAALSESVAYKRLIEKAEEIADEKPKKKSALKSTPKSA